MLTWSGLALGVSSSAHFLKLDISSRALPLFQGGYSAPLVGSLYRGGVCVWKEIGVTPSNP